MRKLLDFVYPSFCVFCKNKISTSNVLCTFCSKHLLLEMDDNVMHVLEENPISVTYLNFIKVNLANRDIKTLAAFTVIKYFRIYKDTPAYVAPSKNELASLVAKQTSKLMQIPFKKKIFSKETTKEEKIFFCLKNSEVKEFKIL